MAEKLRFELVSPERLLLSEEVRMVVIPGSEGNFGVLRRHAPFLSMIRPGVIDIYDEKQVTERIFIAGGYAEVTPERCTVLADSAMPVGEIDRPKVESELKSLREDLEDAKDEAEKHGVSAKIAIAEAKLKAASA
ncbi:MAG TPA: F0F1 ATP synthase subunit epsilon [Alphaproteobacteria bacterium]|nr:F0F1 ATP synthase subunit epsilon [Alphaproteobacteria bacterium]